MKPALDSFTSQYKPGAVTAIENDVVLNWYPPRILQRLGACQHLRLLELGLGHGYTTTWFHPRFASHTVIEGSPEVIGLFRAKHPLPGLNIVESYFETFETTERYHVIVMGFVLEHVDDPARIVAKYRTLLAPGGRLFIAVPNAKSLNRRLGFALGKIPDLYELNANDLLLGHQRQFCLDTLKALLLNNGYTVPWQEGIYLKPLPLAHLQTLPDFEANLRAMCEVGVAFPELCVGLLVEAVPRA
jgi:trans-aconitate methyltransferase